MSASRECRPTCWLVLGVQATILTLAADGARGSAIQEVVIKIGLRSAGVALIVALVLILWGLRNVAAE